MLQLYTPLYVISAHLRVEASLMLRAFEEHKQCAIIYVGKRITAPTTVVSLHIPFQDTAPKLHL